VYPTVVNDYLFVETRNNQKELIYNVFDNLGRLIKSGKVYKSFSSPVKIKLSGLKDGYFYIQIKSNDEFGSFKILKLSSE